MQLRPPRFLDLILYISTNGSEWIFGRIQRQFTEIALGFSTGLLNAAIDLVSFSGILYTIYPPLFVALLLYSVGGTVISIRLGKNLVGLNFQQEAQEANFRRALQLLTCLFKVSR